MQNRLSDTKIRAAKTRGRHCDGNGLWLNVSKTGTKSWVYRYTMRGTGRPQEMGLGGYPSVSLAIARQKRDQYAAMVHNDIDPKIERNKPAPETFFTVANEFYELGAGAWAKKTKDSWQNTINEKCKSLHKRPVDQITVQEIRRTLMQDQLWTAKPDTADRVQKRIEAVLDYATAAGMRSGDNPGRWKGNLEHLLPKRAEKQIKHHAALPYSELPAFFETLRDRDAIASFALQLTILTASRTNEILKAPWSEFDLDNAIWTVPATRMKAKSEHRVPLSNAAMEILIDLEAGRQGEFVFPGQNIRKPLSQMAMMMLLRRMGRGDLTVHGFRSTFRDWSGNQTDFPREVIEESLAHTLGRVERAYRREAAIDKRRRLMNAWGDYCLGVEAGKVIQLNG